MRMALRYRNLQEARMDATLRIGRSDSIVGVPHLFCGTKEGPTLSEKPIYA